MKAPTATSIGASLYACAGQDRAAGQRCSPRARELARDDTVVPAREEPGAPRFTPRQLEVLALLCEGLPNKRICTRLNIATGTVKVHISSILRELGVASRLEAVIAARRYGLLEDTASGGTAPRSVATSGELPTSAAGRQAFGRYADANAF
jgi:DNA-binding NarL/FixJ family response regulator